jgi:hypothetical protein
MKSFIPRIPVILVVLIGLIFAKLQVNKNSGGPRDVCTNICSDGRGYYAWLPAIFIYHDLNFHFFEQEELKSPFSGGTVGGCLQDYRNTIDGRVCDKYYPGASFMMLPFFTIAHVGTVLFTQEPATGYTYLYFKIIGLSGICYYILGMLIVLQILGKLQLNTLQKTLTVIFVTFGTNIMYYAVDKPSYSHIYSFTLIAAFLYFLLCLKDRFAIKYVAYISFLTGFIFIARPVNVSILLFVPFVLWGNIANLWGRFKTRRVYFLSLFPGLIMPILLFTLYKVAVGRFLVYSYDKEGFDFWHPHFWQFLFSPDNGVMPYTPLLLMPFVLLFAWYNIAYRNIVLGIFITMLVTIYIHSSWWCWAYGFGFGARTMLDFAPLSALLIGLSLKLSTTKKYLLPVSVYVLCCFLTMLLYDRKNHGYNSLSPITDYWPAVYSGLGIRAKN